MKKIIPVVLAILLLSALTVSMLAGCTYYAPKDHCIVGLYSRLELLDAEGNHCEPIEKDIHGVDKKLSMEYYSVVKGAEYTIISDYLLFDYTGSGWGSGIKGEYWSSAYWQGSIIELMTITYGENSSLQDEVIYTPNFKNPKGNIKVSFTENCTVETREREFLKVGGILEVVQKGSVPSSEIDSYLNADGSVKEKDGLYYLLLKDEVCVHQDAWKTNLEVTDYEYQSLNDYGVAIQAHFTAKSPVVSANEEVYLHVICRTYDDKFFVYSTVLADAQGFTLPVREHELKLTFANN